MAVAAMKHMASNFVNLDKFKRVKFRIWQKKMHFLVSSMSVVYMLTSPILEEGGDDATADQIRKRAKWDNDDYACRDSSESKYVAEDALSKKLLVSNFTIYKMTDSRPVMEHYNELLGILGRFTQHKINMDKAIQVSCIIDKLPPSWKDFKHTLKHKKEELTLVELGSHLRIDESPKVPDSDKPKSNNVTGPSVVNMFLNALPLEWSKFVTDVKLAKSLYTTNYDQLFAYPSQHERHANEVQIMHERYPDALALVANSQTLYSPSQSPQHSVPSMHPSPQQFSPVYAAPIHHQHHHTLVNPLQQSVSPQPYIYPSVTQQSQAEFP
ncbi:hypothetical protein Tco_0235878 [Tanacetum coccineum]